MKKLSQKFSNYAFVDSMEIEIAIFLFRFTYKFRHIRNLLVGGESPQTFEEEVNILFCPLF